MTDPGFQVVVDDLTRLIDHVSNDTLPTIDAALTRAGGTRVAGGTFSHLEPGAIADAMAVGIAERLEDRLREFRSTFDGVVERLEQSRLEYERAETSNDELTRGVL